MAVFKLFREKLRNKGGASMVLVVCLFLVLCVLGVNLLNAANANTVNSAGSFDTEQTMLYVSSIYEIVNDMIETGSFSDPVTGLLPEESGTAGASFTDARGNPVPVSVAFLSGTMPLEARIEITYENAQGKKETYTVVTTYSRAAEDGKYVRESCKGLVDHAD